MELKGGKLQLWPGSYSRGVRRLGVDRVDIVEQLADGYRCVGCVGESDASKSELSLRSGGTAVMMMQVGAGADKGRAIYRVKNGSTAATRARIARVGSDAVGQCLPYQLRKTREKSHAAVNVDFDICI